MKKIVLHLILFVSFIAGISLYLSLTSFKSTINSSSSIEKKIIGEWVIYDAYREYTYNMDCEEIDLPIDSSLIGQKWVFREDGTCSIENDNLGTWEIINNKHLSILYNGKNVLETYKDEDTNEIITEIVISDFGYECEIEHFEKNGFSISGIFYTNNIYETIHESGDTIYNGMPPENDECIKYSFVRTKTK